MQNLTILNVHHRSLFKHLMFLLLIASLGQLQAQNYKGQNYLGMSLNVLKGEIKPEYKMLLEPLSREEVTYFDGGKLETKRMESENITEATSKYSTHIGMEGSYGAFSAKAAMDMSGELKERSRTKTIIFSKDHTIAKLQIKTQVKDLELASDFEEDLNDPNVSAIELFNNYGTHITLGLKVGGRVSVVYTAKSNSKAAQKSLTVSAEASYAGVTGDVSSSSSSSNSSKSTEINEKWIVYGGDPNLKSAVESRRTATSYDQWAGSIARRPDFFAFTQIKPIWELLASNSRRRAELKQAFEWEFTKISLENPEMFIHESDPAKIITNETLYVPVGYKILSGGAKTHFTGAGNMLTASYPDNNTWKASHKDHHVSSSSKIALYAIAVYDPYNKLEVSSAYETSPSGKLNDVATIPFTNGTDGWAMVGGGAYAKYDCAGSLLTGSYPYINASTGKAGWCARSLDFMVSCPSRLRVFATYARFREGSPYAIETKTFMQGETTGKVMKYKAVISEKGWNLVGGGAVTATNDAAQKQTINFLIGSYPHSNMRMWIGESKDHHISGPAKLMVIAIGLKVVKK